MFQVAMPVTAKATTASAGPIATARLQRLSWVQIQTQSGVSGTGGACSLGGKVPEKIDGLGWVRRDVKEVRSAARDRVPIKGFERIQLSQTF